MSKEVWKDVVGYEGLYQVSSIGRVKSLPKSGPGGHLESIILKQNTDKGGNIKYNLILVICVLN